MKDDGLLRFWNNGNYDLISPTEQAASILKAFEDESDDCVPSKQAGDTIYNCVAFIDYNVEFSIVLPAELSLQKDSRSNMAEFQLVYSDQSHEKVLKYVVEGASGKAEVQYLDGVWVVKDIPYFAYID